MGGTYVPLYNIMNKHLLYFLFRLSIVVALWFRYSSWVNPRVCRFIHSRNQQVVSCPTTNNLRKYAVASQFAYFKKGDPYFEGSLLDMKQVYGDGLVYTPFFKDGTEKETDEKRQILAGYIIQVNDFTTGRSIETVVAFRGTKKKEWVEWKNNMDGQPVLRHFTHLGISNAQTETPVDDNVAFSLWVHRGITKEYDRCRLDFLEKIKQVYQGGELVFVGHSKGIISHLGALDFVVHFNTEKRCFPIHLISFGAYRVFAHLSGGDDPCEIFKKWGLQCSRVHFLRDPVVHYPFFRPCYQHVADTTIYLKQPPNSLLEHSIYNYKRFFMDIPPTQK